MTTKKIPDAVTLILSDARGIYIPRDFLCDDANEIATEHCAAWGLNADNFGEWLLATEPDSEGYWDAWDWVLTHAKYVDDAGNTYCLHQDGDLWALCVERMTEDEKENFGFDD